MQSNLSGDLNQNTSNQICFVTLMKISDCSF